MSSSVSLLKRSSLERLERLAIHWKHSFNGLVGGSNRSRYVGTGHEFFDHRHFHRGDDLRVVNWRAYLRLERIFVKTFCTEPRTPIRLLLDCSGSMACGASTTGPGEEKFTYACRLAAALCFIGLVRLETVFIQPFSDNLKEGFRVDGGRHRYALAANFLERLLPIGQSDFYESTRQFLAPKPAPGLAIVISDFLDAEGCDTALRHLADFGHELLLLHVAGPDDRQPTWRGELELVDAESGDISRMNVDHQSVLEYTASYDKFCRHLKYIALRGRGRYIHLVTDTSIEDSLCGVMNRAGLVSMH